jgi:hypothetical protein
MMLASPICMFQQLVVTTTLQMQASQTPFPCCYPIEGYIITFKNGAVLSFGVYILLIALIIVLFLHFHGSPANPQELFNLRHASARNIVERIFGILKNRFAILRHNPNLDVDTQAEIPPALAAIHNFIREYDGEELEDLLHQDDADRATESSHHEATGDLAQGPARTAERKAADTRRDRIANEMWHQYKAELRRRGIK